MDADPALDRLVAKEARGLDKLGGVFEFIGWVNVAAGVALGALIGLQDRTIISGNIRDGITASTEKNWAAGVAFGVASVLAGLFLVALARALELFAVYCAARFGENVRRAKR